MAGERPDHLHPPGQYHNLHSCLSPAASDAEDAINKRFGLVRYTMEAAEVLFKARVCVQTLRNTVVTCIRVGKTDASSSGLPFVRNQRCLCWMCSDNTTWQSQ